MLDMGEIDKVTKEMLIRMCLRCNKVRKHKPKSVKETQLKVDGIESPLFAESEIKERRFSRGKANPLRTAMLKYVNDGKENL